MTFNIPNKITRYLAIAYFVLAFVEIIVELLEYKPLLFLLRLSIPIVLMLLYGFKSAKPNPYFLGIILLQLICNVLVLYTHSEAFIYTILGFILMRLLSIVLVLRLTKQKNYLYFTVATFPFLVIFFYLISITSEIPEYEFNILIFQSMLISLLGGISIVNYFKNDNVQNSWLLISTLLYMGLRFLVFIERYFLPGQELSIYRPIEVLLTTFALYAFYKYVVIAESSNGNNSQ